MIDRNSQFMAILTNVGAAKLANANALGIPWNLTALGVGDANGTDPIPSATQTKLINEQRRAPLNQLRVDPVNAAVIIAEQVIPADVGGWWIREIGVYDSDGDLVAVSNCAPSYKSLLDQGSGRTQIVRMNFIVSSINNIVLKIDPAIVLATREYVDLAITEAINKQDFKHSVLVATTANIALTGIQTIDGVLLSADARVLVKNQAQAKDNGIYLVPASGAWKRAQDADTSIEVTPGLFVHVEKGTANGDSAWQLVTDAPIILGTTLLGFEMVAGRTGIVAGTYRSLTVDKLGRVIAGTNPTTLAESGITNGATKTELAEGLASKQAALGYVPVQQGTGIGQSANPVKIGHSPFGPKITVDNTDFGLIWCQNNFKPDDKADKSNTYTIAQTEAGLGNRPMRDGITWVGLASDDPKQPYMRRATDGSLVMLAVKSTALLAVNGWKNDADTGEIVQWVEIAQGDISATTIINVAWPFKFPNQFLNARISLKFPNSQISCAIQVSYSGGSTTGCVLRIEEWASVIQTGMVIVVEARGS